MQPDAVTPVTITVSTPTDLSAPVGCRPTTAVHVDTSAPSEGPLSGDSGYTVAGRNCPEADKTPSLEGRETEPGSRSDEQQASYSSERDACGHRFLCENEQREANDPSQVHYACIEQEGH